MKKPKNEIYQWRLETIENGMIVYYVGTQKSGTLVFITFRAFMKYVAKRNRYKVKFIKL